MTRIPPLPPHLLSMVTGYMCRRSCQGDSPGLEDAGPGSSRCGRQHQGAPGCRSHAGFCPVRHGGLCYADPRGPPGPGPPWGRREPAETGTGQDGSY